MFFKVFCFFVVIATALTQESHNNGKAHSSVSINHHSKHGEQHGDEGYRGEGYNDEHKDYHAYPKYEFEYKVEDHHTGDIKSQHESRDGDVVKGRYALHQPDGHEREVHYQGDHKTGCFAVLVAVAAAQYGHEHGSVYFSNYISHHDGHQEVVHGHHEDDYHAHPKYEFEYNVKDPHTGDIKDQHESRDGDHVKRHYSLHKPDGSVRPVHYHENHHIG